MPTKDVFFSTYNCLVFCPRSYIYGYELIPFIWLCRGGDVKQGQKTQTEQIRQLQAQSNSKAESGTLRQLTAQNLSHIVDITEAFYSHPKVLVSALNGPAIGLSAALVAHSDFIYAMPHTYLLAPFTTIGIAAEGGASATFIQRLGFAKAAEALLMSKRITCAELQSCGFVNEVFDTDKDTGRFLERVFQELDKRLHKSLDARSVLRIKSLMRQPSIPLVASQTIAEALQVTEDLARRAGAAMSSSGSQSQKL